MFIGRQNIQLPKEFNSLSGVQFKKIFKMLRNKFNETMQHLYIENYKLLIR